MARKKVQETLELVTYYKDFGSKELKDTFGHYFIDSFIVFMRLNKGTRVKIRIIKTTVWCSGYVSNSIALGAQNNLYQLAMNSLIANNKLRKDQVNMKTAYQWPTCITVNLVVKAVDNLDVITTKTVQEYIVQNFNKLIEPSTILKTLVDLQSMQLLVRDEENSTSRKHFWLRTDRSFYLDDKYLV